MFDCLVSEDGKHHPIEVPTWADEEEELGGIICRDCGESL